MKILNIAIITFVFSTFTLGQVKAETKAETNVDCSEIKASTGVLLYKKIRCKMGSPVTEENALGTKLKKILKNPFKKKSDN